MGAACCTSSKDPQTQVTYLKGDTSPSSPADSIKDGSKKDSFRDEGMGKFRGKVFGGGASKLSSSSMGGDLGAIFPKSDEEKNALRLAVRDSILFTNFTQKAIDDVIDLMYSETLSANDTLELADRFCVVKEGLVDVMSGKDRVASAAGPGTCFGELSILHSSANASTIRALQNSTLWLVTRRAFNNLIEVTRTNELVQIEKFLRSVTMFAGMTAQERLKMADLFELEILSSGDPIITEGDVGDKFYILREGEAAVSVKGNQVDYKYNGDFFGEQSLLKDQPRNATIKAVGHVEILSLQRAKFTEILGPLQDILDRNIQGFGKVVLGGISLLSSLSSADRDALAEHLIEEDFEDGTHVFEEGEAGDKLYIIIEGEVKVMVGPKQIDHLTKGAFFGERALLDNKPRMAGVEALGNLKCLTMSREVFERVLVPLDSTKELMWRRREREDTRDMTKLHVVRVVGQGAFGIVKMVQHSTTKKTYALKAMERAWVERKRWKNVILREKNTLHELVPHPNVITLFHTFQDQNYLYMLMELALGGELYQLLSKEGRFPCDQAKFYCGCTIAAMKHLHKQSIIYRDLKPENMIVDDKGYLKLIDMGFAKKVPIGSKTYTLCGTPYYLSPEMINHTGHDKATDWWTVGVLLYEMIVGEPPFLGDNELEVYSKVTRCDMSYPSYYPEKAMLLTKQLLTLDATKRLGNLKNDGDDIIAEEWFHDLDFLALHNRTLQAPYIPPVDMDGDAKSTEKLFTPLDPKSPDHWPDW